MPENTRDSGVPDRASVLVFFVSSLNMSELRANARRMDA